ncbi:MAG: hypothetical protein IJ478_00375 [Alistipes sp.]|nr:hypothetical protein [Alistipes sp.]
MTTAERIIDAVRKGFDTLLYFAVMAWKEDFRDEVKRAGTVGERRPMMAVLGNGPSLKGELEELLRDPAARDFMAVNFFAEDERFMVLRPAYYVLSDPMFFRLTSLRGRIEQFYRTLNERVTWPMNLYVQYYNPEHFDYRAHLTNPLIRIVRFHTITYYGFRAVRHWLFNHGLGSGNFGTVVQVGELIALQLGYRRVELYGVDHTLLERLTVDGENRLCRADRHFYDDDTTPHLKPMMQKVPEVPYTMAVYLQEVADLFRGHELLRDYADSLGAEIVNCTRSSMIDAYRRRG